MNIWKCSVCNYIHDGEEAPDKCPKCGALKEEFGKMDEEIANLIQKSRRTNDIHMEIESRLQSIAPLAEEGIKESLDPNCVLIFQRVLKDVKEISQSIKAEIQAHISKNKWG